jgi:hypothetical protein
MSGQSQFQGFGMQVFLKSDMRAFLADNDPPVTLLRSDNFLVPQAWYFGHTATSMISVSGDRGKSSSTGSKYNSMASLIFDMVCSRVSPSLMQPGKLGT